MLVSNRAIYVADNENFAISRRRLPYTGIGLAGVSANREHVILHARKQIAEGDL